MGGCVAPHCRNRSDKGARLFLFPRDPERRKIWATRCGKPNWQPSAEWRLCSKHFEEDQFEQRRADGWKKLKPNAVPTLFNDAEDGNIPTIDEETLIKESPTIIVSINQLGTLNDESPKLAEQLKVAYKCSVCRMSFSLYKNLRRHTLKFHRDHSELVPLKKALKVFKFPCDSCHRKFNLKGDLVKHQNKIHNHNPTTLKWKKCSLCDKDITREKFQHHLSSTHDIELSTESLNFPTLHKFTEWKENMERDTNSKFRQARGIQSTNKNFRRLAYVCSQSLKKVGGFCPATINVRIDKNGGCEVKYAKTHICHQTRVPFPDVPDGPVEIIHLVVHEDDLAARQEKMSKLLTELAEIAKSSTHEQLDLMEAKLAQLKVPGRRAGGENTNGSIHKL